MPCAPVSESSAELELPTLPYGPWSERGRADSCLRAKEDSDEDSAVLFEFSLP